MELTESIVIPATPAAVWQVLTDLDRYAEWNPFIVRAAGTVAEGARFEARFQPPGGRGATLRPRFTAVEPGRRLAWLGHVLVPHVFDGAHELVLAPAAGGTRLTQTETFGGALVPFLRGSLPATRAGFVAMNEALSVRVRRLAATS